MRLFLKIFLGVLAITFIIVGISGHEPETVFVVAIRICLSCIGLG